jgi:protein-tyrosine-phosphatase
MYLRARTGLLQRQIAGVGMNSPQEKKRMLFVCVENSNRSQMAEAFARIYGGQSIEAFSAGSRPSGVVNPKAVAAMRELGYDLTTHTSKSLDDIPQLEYDFVATMGCGDACPLVRAKERADWQIPDPKNLPAAEFNQVRDLIADKVKTALGLRTSPREDQLPAGDR